MTLRHPRPQRMLSGRRCQTRRLASAVALAAVLALSLSCGKNGGKPSAAPPKAPVPVLAAAAVRKDVPVELRAIGNVECFATVSVKSQVGGQLASVHFKEGQEVKKGDLLFSIDPRSCEAQVRQAEANLARSQIQASNAERDARRFANLLKTGAVSQDLGEKARTAADALEATVRADRATLETWKLQLEYCSIRSPLDGQTGSLQVNEGNLVRANDDRGLVVINQIRPIYVSFAVPESHLTTLKERMAAGKLAVQAAIPGLDGATETGTLTFLDNAVDHSTGMIRLKAVFDNADRRLWPGQFVETALTLSVDRGALTVPAQAVQTGQQGTYVYALKAGSTVEMRPVAVARTFGLDAVIEKGLEPGEKVVTDGHLRLATGARVEVTDSLGANKPESSS